MMKHEVQAMDVVQEEFAKKKKKREENHTILEVLRRKKYSSYPLNGDLGLLISCSYFD